MSRMNFQYAFFLGRHPLLSACEAWRVVEPFAPSLIHANERLLLVETPQQLTQELFPHLGGSDRVGRVVAHFPSLPTPTQLLDALSPLLAAKIAFGLSTFSDLGFDRKFLVAIKKEARQRGLKLRFIEPNTKDERQLSSAQVLFNGLYREPNAEITVVKVKDAFLAVRTIWVQDIQAYERRDTGRPVRDARVGMLPPKLAQQMINFAVSHIPTFSLTLYDPFCGLGTILQEGVLRGFSMVGSDASAEMVAAAKRNVAALSSHTEVDIFQHDARGDFPSRLKRKIGGIVTEPYLGKPLSAPLPAEEVDAYVDELLPLYRAFFKSAAGLLSPRAPLLFVLPRLRTSQGWVSFPASFIDEIATFGYHLEHLVPAVLEPFFGFQDPTVLEYNRPDALVGRDLRLWTRI